MLDEPASVKYLMTHYFYTVNLLATKNTMQQMLMSAHGEVTAKCAEFPPHAVMGGIACCVRSAQHTVVEGMSGKAEVFACSSSDMQPRLLGPLSPSALV